MLVQPEAPGERVGLRDGQQRQLRAVPAPPVLEAGVDRDVVGQLPLLRCARAVHRPVCCHEVWAELAVAFHTSILPDTATGFPAVARGVAVETDWSSMWPPSDTHAHVVSAATG